MLQGCGGAQAGRQAGGAGSQSRAPIGTRALGEKCEVSSGQEMMMIMICFIKPMGEIHALHLVHPMLGEVDCLPQG